MPEKTNAGLSPGTGVSNIIYLYVRAVTSCPRGAGVSALGVSSDQSDQSDLSDGALSARRVARADASPPKKPFVCFVYFVV